MTHPARIVAFLSTSALCLGLAGPPEAMAERAWERAVAESSEPAQAVQARSQSAEDAQDGRDQRYARSRSASDSAGT